ncbi:MAG TPA: hypothetical protein VLY04_04425 [Bryobacteraceae bacterium]|nr:hypothetical protein [Bryobacteraceae bacterium]
MTPEVQAPAVAPPAAVRPEAPPLGFHNRVAVRIALLVALSATALFFLPYVNWFAAGFFAVLLYRRRTGFLLNMESGVRMGWITGLLMFAMLVVLFVVSMLAIRALGGVAVVQAQFKNAFDPRVLEALKALENAPEMAGQLVVMFFFVTCLSMAGGALGARLVGRS